MKNLNETFFLLAVTFVACVMALIVAQTAFKIATESVHVSHENWVVY